MSIRIGTGPYLGEIPSENPKPQVSAVLEQARKKLRSMEKLPNLRNRLEEQIERLEQTEIPEFEKLTKYEDAVSQKKSSSQTLASEAAALIRQAYSLQRYEAQTKPISKDEQRNFAKLLFNRIDPIDQNGARTKTKKLPSAFSDFFKKTIKDLGLGIVEFLLYIPLSQIGKRVKALASQNDFKEAADLLMDGLELANSNMFFQLREQLPEALSDNGVVPGVTAGLTNALNIHFALVKVAAEKLFKLTGSYSEVFKANFKNLLANLSETSKQLAKIKGITLKLIENLNGVESNQREPYHFDSNNFEIVQDSDQLYLLPTIDFLGKTIQSANDPETKVRSGAGKIEEQETNFAEEYASPDGCPIYDVKIEVEDQELNFADTYFKSIDQATVDLFTQAI